MRRLADEPQDMPLDAVGADHRAGRSTHRLEHRPLLDVQLQVGARPARVERAPRLEHAIDVDAVLGQRVGEARALAIDEVAHGVGDEAAAGARRPEQAAREARALFVGEVHDGQRDGWRRTAAVAAERLDAGQHAERAVEPAAVGHGIEVAADDDGLGSRAGQRDPVVAGDVGLGAQPIAGQPLVEPAARVTPHRPPRHPLGTLGVARPRRQGAEVGNHVRCGHRSTSARDHSVGGGWARLVGSGRWSRAGGA